LKAMGWDGSSGLGKRGQGITEPVDADDIQQRAIANEQRMKMKTDSRRKSVDSRNSGTASVPGASTDDPKHKMEPPPTPPVYLELGEACEFEMQMEKVPLLIGKSGETIKNIQEQLQVKIIPPPRDQTGWGTVIVEGHDTSKAHKMILELVGATKGLKKLSLVKPDAAKRESWPRGPGSVSFTIVPEKGALIIGKKGANLKNLTERFAVTVKLPGKDFKGRKALVLIQGADPSGALEYIETIVGTVSDVNWLNQATPTRAQHHLASGKGKGKGWWYPPSNSFHRAITNTTAQTKPVQPKSEKQQLLERIQELERAKAMRLQRAEKQHGSDSEGPMAKRMKQT